MKRAIVLFGCVTCIFLCVSVISSVGVAASFGRTWFPPCEDFGLVDWQLSSAKTKVSRLS